MTTSLEARLRGVGVIPVVTLSDVDVAVPLAQALVDAGLPCVEVAFRSAAAQKGLEAIRRAFPDLLLGAGTVLDEEQLDAASSAGADFVVSPGTTPAIVRAAQRRRISILSGVCTPSEVELARGLGLHTLKLFPAAPIGGAAYLRALCAPYGELSFVPTGGITAATLPEYLAIPQVLACGGSWMVKPEFLEERAFDRVGALAEEARDLVRQAR